MTKLSAQQIEARVERMLAHLQRLLDAGEITPKDAELAMQDLARWSACQYAKLPQVQAIESVMNVLLGSRR